MLCDPIRNGHVGLEGREGELTRLETVFRRPRHEIGSRDAEQIHDLSVEGGWWRSSHHGIKLMQPIPRRFERCNSGEVLKEVVKKVR